MTTPDATTDDLLTRLVGSLARAHTPLTVESYDPAETLDDEIGTRGLTVCRLTVRSPRPIHLTVGRPGARYVH